MSKIYQQETKKLRKISVANPLEESTVLGISKIFNNRSFKIRMIVWIIILLIAAAVFIFHTQTIIKDYAKRSTTIAREFNKIQELEFPTLKFIIRFQSPFDLIKFIQNCGVDIETNLNVRLNETSDSQHIRAKFPRIEYHANNLTVEKIIDYSDFRHYTLPDFDHCQAIVSTHVNNLEVVLMFNYYCYYDGFDKPKLPLKVDMTKLKQDMWTLITNDQNAFFTVVVNPTNRDDFEPSSASSQCDYHQLLAFNPTVQLIVGSPIQFCYSCASSTHDYNHPDAQTDIVPFFQNNFINLKLTETSYLESFHLDPHCSSDYPDNAKSIIEPSFLQKQSYDRSICVDACRAAFEFENCNCSDKRYFLEIFTKSIKDAPNCYDHSNLYQCHNFSIDRMELCERKCGWACKSTTYTFQQHSHYLMCECLRNEGAPPVLFHTGIGGPKDGLFYIENEEEKYTLAKLCSDIASNFNFYLCISFALLGELIELILILIYHLKLKNKRQNGISSAKTVADVHTV